MVFSLALSGGMLLVGWVMLYAGLIWYRQQQLIVDTPTSNVQSMAMGRVELNGEIEPAVEPFRAPFSGTDCVGYRYLIKTHHTDSDGRDKWSAQETGTEIVPFYVNDGTGRVLVNPDGANFDVQQNVFNYASGEAESDEIQQGLAERTERLEQHSSSIGITQFSTEAHGFRQGDASDTIESKPRRRYVEELLPVGEEIYVFGKAKEDSRAEVDPGTFDPHEDAPERLMENAVVGPGDDLPLFTISHKSEDELVDENKTTILMILAFGLMFAGGGFLFLVAQWGAILGVIITAITLAITYASKDYVSQIQFGSPS